MDYTTILAVSVLVIFLFLGPKKIPELAKAFGKARRTFENASKGIEEVEIAPDSLVRAAQDIGIETKGKTRQQISDELIEASKNAR